MKKSTQFRKRDHPGWERFVSYDDEITVHRPDGKGGYRLVSPAELRGDTKMVDGVEIAVAPVDPLNRSDDES